MSEDRVITGDSSRTGDLIDDGSFRRVCHRMPYIESSWSDDSGSLSEDASWVWSPASLPIWASAPSWSSNFELRPFVLRTPEVDCNALEDSYREILFSCNSNNSGSNSEDPISQLYQSGPIGNGINYCSAIIEIVQTADLLYNYCLGDGSNMG